MGGGGPAGAGQGPKQPPPPRGHYAIAWSKCLCSGWAGQHQPYQPVESSTVQPQQCPAATLSRRSGHSGRMSRGACLARFQRQSAAVPSGCNVWTAECEARQTPRHLCRPLTLQRGHLGDLRSTAVAMFRPRQRLWGEPNGLHHVSEAQHTGRALRWHGGDRDRPPWPVCVCVGCARPGLRLKGVLYPPPPRLGMTVSPAPAASARPPRSLQPPVNASTATATDLQPPVTALATAPEPSVQPPSPSSAALRPPWRWGGGAAGGDGVVAHQPHKPRRHQGPGVRKSCLTAKTASQSVRARRAPCHASTVTNRIRPSAFRMQ